MSGLETAIIAGLAKAGSAAAATAAGATSSAGAIAATAGTILSTAGAISQAKGAKVQGEYQNALAQQRAKEERALGIQRSQEERRRGRIIASRARAVGAASGGGLDFDLMGDLEEETELRAQNAIFEGEGRSRNSQQRGAEALFTGRQRRKAGLIRAGGTLLGGASSIYDKYSGVT